MRYFYLFILSVALNSCDPMSKLYVKFGEAKPVLEAKGDGVIRIFFDRMGAIYPDVPISDDEVLSTNSGLNKLYSYDQNVQSRVNNYYGFPPGTTFDQLQQRLVDETTARINTAGVGKQLVFLIHGYNNHPLKPEKDNSYVVYKTLREIILNKYKGRVIQFVEIYWDGTSKKNGKEGREWSNSIKSWSRAQPSSNNVAVELRRILSRINNDNNIVITHSLGASVITCALFNAEKFPEDFMRGIREKYNNTAVYSTPLKNFKIGMIAPAIPGYNTFSEFKDRTPVTRLIYNYQFIIGFNQHDKVLRKYFGLDRYLGSTTLGCNSKELKKVRKKVNLSGNTVVSVEYFSKKANGKKQKKHDFLEYIANQQHLDKLLEFLFQ